MTADDPLETQRDVLLTVEAELEAAGFADAQEVGRGGFGVVYRCVQTALDRTVAVKVLTAELDEENMARFLREQRAMGRLTGHPNIVNVLHVGATGTGRPYLVMQYHPQDSLEARIRSLGPLGLNEALRDGVKMAGALETAHQLGILHRDVKPSNILLTDYGEPALTDFGIAHIAGGFETATGVVTGSPAFTAPEVLRGEPPSPASDIYGLGATLFCAITGHAAFERRRGEQMVAQFVRITTEPVPDLRGQGLPEDVCAAVERSMTADPGDRPATALEFGDALREIERRHDYPVDFMALHTEPGAQRRDQDPVRARSGAAGSVSSEVRPPRLPVVRATREGNLPFELTSFVGRRRELNMVKHLFLGSRLVTLTGIGGVGKTRLALRVGSESVRAFDDGVWWADLGELRDASLLEDVVAASLRLRNQSARSVQEALMDYLAPRRLLLILDNCEQVVEAVAALSAALLSTCPELRILATSREPLSINGETALRVPPLGVPDLDRQTSLRGLPQYDAVTLFAQRAVTAVPGFELTEDNRTIVTRICQRLDGLPLPLELAAARLRAMSAQQILERLTDRYRLLTGGSRAAPSRQQTLRLCVDWSYDLCTTREQCLWAKLSVFVSGFELDAAEGISAGDLSPEDLLDTLASLVDKSILIREEQGTVVRYRMLETLRDYGREKLRDIGEDAELRQRHQDWYQRLAVQAEAAWVSSLQVQWIARLEREQPNLREAMEFSLTERGDANTGLRIATAMYPFWLARGLLGEGRRWLARVLVHQSGQVTAERVNALCAGSVLAGLQGDLPAGTTLLDEGRALAEQLGDPSLRALVTYADGNLANFSGDVTHAAVCFEDALKVFREEDNLLLRIWALIGLALASGPLGDEARALASYEEALALTEPRGESVNRSYALWTLGLAAWQEGNSAQGEELVRKGLRLTQAVGNRLSSGWCLEILAWIAADGRQARRAAVLMGAAASLSRAVGSSTVVVPNLLPHHELCERRTRSALGEPAFVTEFQRGEVLSFEAAVAYALDEQLPVTSPARTASNLTKRERQVADLVAQGLTNKEIAAKLVISPRTAQGHVEHVLTKLGFTSRAQIAAWVVEQSQG
ncbi:protein kinase domain-containing protein [Rhodococcus wratislaviensis]|uniref:Putative serine/threonine protein kinase n=1 Tax=Rhodococcus wratislaviensis NBRC 100605 TaxID=1219028 RepID=X0PYY9_RHOWR|nr:protein kinase [Rhodococcus wratislaviensis]GAF43667.1 putative serine/threonine protein kinase [Rhodococcus wratislaviensis NBRC 100605]